MYFLLGSFTRPTCSTSPERGEDLPRRFFQLQRPDLETCDLLLAAASAEASKRSVAAESLGQAGVEAGQGRRSDARAWFWFVWAVIWVGCVVTVVFGWDVVAGGSIGGLERWVFCKAHQGWCRLSSFPLNSTQKVMNTGQ